MAELKPCPFCGGKASIKHYASKELFRKQIQYSYVQCDTCNVRTDLVTCTVNMDAGKEQSVIVKATKPHIAIQKAEAELRNDGYFHARAFYCNEIGERREGE